MLVDSWGVKAVVPYVLENESPRVFSLFSRNLRNDKWVFPLGRTVFVRVVDDKMLLANADFEFVFLSINDRLVLMSFQIELRDFERAFELVRNENPDVQLAAAKAFLVR